MKYLFIFGFIFSSCSFDILTEHFVEYTYEVDYCWPRECSIDTITIVSRATPRQTVLEKVPVLIYWPTTNMTGQSLSGICASRLLSTQNVEK
jgi:hypothetical protein